MLDLSKFSGGLGFPVVTRTGEGALPLDLSNPIAVRISGRPSPVAQGVSVLSSPKLASSIVPHVLEALFEEVLA